MISVSVLQSLEGTLAFLTINGPIVPGQPLSLTWELDSFIRDLDLGTVRGTISLDNDVLYTSSDIPYIVTGYAASTGPQTVIIDPPMNDAVARTLYKIGAKILKLSVSGSKGPGPFTDEEVLLVVPEVVDRTLWSWTSPPVDGSGRAHISWKQA